ncbi:MAG: hypothetical protein GXC75_04285 [Xanthomonadaceae bacterium]|nr:hypothetical protein [Xanthomonadaceae bacterium]
MTAFAAHALDPAYARKLERSGCTQASELQGCDINKTRAENARAGFGASATPAKPVTTRSPYLGSWVARTKEGVTVASISIDAREHVLVNGKSVKATRSDGGLQFTQGFVTYFIQGDRRLKGEDTWRDSEAGTTGPIFAK